MYFVMQCCSQYIWLPSSLSGIFGIFCGRNYIPSDDRCFGIPHAINSFPISVHHLRGATDCKLRSYAPVSHWYESSSRHDVQTLMPQYSCKFPTSYFAIISFRCKFFAFKCSRYFLSVKVFAQFRDPLSSRIKRKKFYTRLCFL